MLWPKKPVRPPPSRRLTPSSDLWDIVLDMRWDDAVVHAKEFPEDAQWQDDNRESPLYLACQLQAPCRVIQALLDAFPAAVHSTSRTNRDLPIHIACRYQAGVDVLRVLLDRFPGTAIQETRWGKTAIMALWESAGLKGEDFWAKVEVVLFAVARHREEQLPKKQELHLVHAAVSLGALGCPLDILRYLLDNFPTEARARDRLGLLPLHICVGPTAWSSSTKRRYKPREQAVIALLLEAYPEAIRTPLLRDSYRYPLHSALANRHTWRDGVEDLFRAAPELVAKQDPKSGLVPFLLAAIPVRDTKVDLDTIYALLRADPSILNILSSLPTCPTNKVHPSDSPWDDAGPGFREVIVNTYLGTMTALVIGAIMCASYVDE